MPTITGTDSAETLFGSWGDDDIFALGGNDMIMLTPGHDMIDGGNGDDLAFGDASTVGVAAGPRNYTVTANTITDGGGALDTTFTNLERITFTDTSGYDVTIDAGGFAGEWLQFSLGLGDHSFTGSATADFLIVEGGSGTMDGGGGTDGLTVGAYQTTADSPLVVTSFGGVTQFQSDLQAVSASNVENLTVRASSASFGLYVDASQCEAALLLMASSYADTVVGGSGADFFANFGGGDVIAGLGGADTFWFLNPGQFNAATILDLESDDTISLVPSPFGPPPTPKFFIGSGGFTGLAGEYRYYTWQGQTFLVGDSNGDGVGDSTLTIANGAFNLAETAAGSNVLHIASVVPPPEPGPTTIDGTAGDDQLEGGAGDDTVNGLGGNDRIDGGADDDQLNGGSGDDEIYGGDGDDVIDGGAGADYAYGEDGNDTLTTGGDGGVNQDLLTGGLGDDTIIVSGGVFQVFGDEPGGGTGQVGDGNDHIVATGVGGSWLNGQGGDDVIEASGPGSITVSGGTGNDDITLTGFSSGNVNLDAGNDTVRLGTGFFTVYVGANSPGDGQDTIIMTSSGAGLITLIGFAAGEQGDRLDLSIYGDDPFGTGTLVMSANGLDTIIDDPSSGMRYVLQNVRGVNLSAYNLGVANPGFAPVDLTLNDLYADNPDIEFGGELVGADANDTIRGFGGDDSLFGSGGDDRILGARDHDTLDGGSGDDELLGGGHRDVLIGGVGNDRLDGGAGIDTADYSDAAAGVHVRLDRASAQNTGGAGIDTLANIERVTGSNHDDRLTGNALANLLEGGAGDDILNGLAGADTLRGGAGDDIYDVDDAGDKVFELAGEGTDRVRTTVDYALADNVEMLTLAGAARVGTGNALANTLFGAGGADTLAGLAGDDILRGDGARDGLDGGDGNDLLDGGVGKDTMTGGSGNDTFQFRDGDFGGTRSVADVITDFSQADGEKIRLNLVDANTVAGGNQAFAWLGTGAFTGVAGQLHYAQAGGNTYVEGDLDGDSVADIFIALTGTINLTAADFVL